MQLYQSGDKDALEALCENNNGMVRLMAYKYKLENVSNMDHDDLIQQGFFSLIGAASRYDASKGASFCHYLSFYLKSQMSRYLTQYNTADKECSLYKPVGEDNTTLADLISNEVDYAEQVIEDIDNKILHDKLHKALNRITFEKQEVLKKYYGFEEDRTYTLNELGEICELSPERIRVIRNSALKELKRSKDLMSYRSEHIKKELRECNQKALDRGNISCYNPYLEEEIKASQLKREKKLEELKEQLQKDREELRQWMKELKCGT